MQNGEDVVGHPQRTQEKSFVLHDFECLWSTTHTWGCKNFIASAIKRRALIRADLLTQHFRTSASMQSKEKCLQLRSHS